MQLQRMKVAAGMDSSEADLRQLTAHTTCRDGQRETCKSNHTGKSQVSRHNFGPPSPLAVMS